jgi:hypothetical protein
MLYIEFGLLEGEEAKNESNRETCYRHIVLAANDVVQWYIRRIGPVVSLESHEGRGDIGQSRPYNPLTGSAPATANGRENTHDVIHATPLKAKVAHNASNVVLCWKA